VAGAASDPAGTLRERVEACQRAAIEQALAAHGGRWAGAARELGLDPSNLHKLAQRLGCAPARPR
jgi:anaerobic nitric oxide reductase transcription regulator